MKRVGFGLLFGVGACIMGAIASYFLTLQRSPDRHDRELEAATTSVFFFGPAGAILGFVAGVVRGGRSSAAPEVGR